MYKAIGMASRDVYYENNLKSEVIRFLNGHQLKTKLNTDKVYPEPILVTNAVNIGASNEENNLNKHDYIIRPVSQENKTFRKFRSWRHLKKFFDVRDEILESAIKNRYEIKGYLIDKVVQ
ncbi:hypothetical protein ACVPPR_07375 [Dellaglioa sp. L3N]